MTGEDQSSFNRLAILIDADNASADLIEPLLKEVTKYGIAHVKRIYGDWTDSKLGKWKDKLNSHAIQPIQQFRYTTGKNATDSALIIDAMDLLYTKSFDGFCIVSSDSDFTRLASRIRENGLIVYGFGEKKTPAAFVNACDRFFYTEILKEAEDETAKQKIESSRNGNQASKQSNHSKTSIAKQKLRSNGALVKLLKDAYKALDDEDGWAPLSAFGSQLTKLSPAFDPRNYEYTKLSALIQEIDLFEIKEVPHGKGSAKSIHIKLKLY